MRPIPILSKGTCISGRGRNNKANVFCLKLPQNLFSDVSLLNEYEIVRKERTALQWIPLNCKGLQSIKNTQHYTQLLYSILLWNLVNKQLFKSLSCMLWLKNVNPMKLNHKSLHFLHFWGVKDNGEVKNTSNINSKLNIKVYHTTHTEKELHLTHTHTQKQNKPNKLQNNT